MKDLGTTSIFLTGTEWESLVDGYGDSLDTDGLEPEDLAYGEALWKKVAEANFNADVEIKDA